jgi:2-iminoacetate synthase
LRLLLPTCGIVLSTREGPRLRDGLMQLGVTSMSAGASTEPGGYSSFDENWTPGEQKGEQFHIADERPPETVAAAIRACGYEPVWKDFDSSLVIAN